MAATTSDDYFNLSANNSHVNAQRIQCKDISFRNVFDKKRSNFTRAKKEYLCTRF